jgi:hypothetical protein
LVTYPTIVEMTQHNTIQCFFNSDIQDIYGANTL